MQIGNYKDYMRSKLGRNILNETPFFTRLLIRFYGYLKAKLYKC